MVKIFGEQLSQNMIEFFRQFRKSKNSKNTEIPIKVALETETIIDTKNTEKKEKKEEETEEVDLF